MISPPSFQERHLMIGNETQNAPGLPLAAAHYFSHFRPKQIDHHDPSRTDDVDMCRRVVVGIDHDPQSLDAQDRRHLFLLAEPKRSGNHYGDGYSVMSFGKHKLLIQHRRAVLSKVLIFDAAG